MTAGDRGADNQEQIQWCLREPLEGRACRKLQGPPHRQAGGSSKAQVGPWARPMVGKRVQLGLESILKRDECLCHRQRGLGRKEAGEGCRGLKRGVPESRAAFHWRTQAFPWRGQWDLVFPHWAVTERAPHKPSPPSAACKHCPG